MREYKGMKRDSKAVRPGSGRGAEPQTGRVSILDKCVFAVLAFAAAHTAAGPAVRVDVPAAQYADGEASAVVPLPAPGPGDRNLRLTLSLSNASVTNNAEIEVGGTVAGWDRGEWFVLGDGLRERVSAPGGSGGARELAVLVRTGASGGVSRVAFRADGAAVDFGGGPSPSWLDPEGGVPLRVTARGGAGDVSATAGWSPDGTALILR